MRILDIRERALPLHANIQNSVVNFAEHTVSLVAVISDVRRNGRPVAGVAFDSIGRYAQSGLLRERFIRRLLAAAPEEIVRTTGVGIDVDKAFKVMMRNEKPGGHGDRAHAVAALELALWDLNAKLADEPAYATIAKHYGVASRPNMPVYAAGGYYYPEDNLGRLQDEMRSYADLGYSKFKMKIGGAPLGEDMRRIEAAIKAVGAAQDLAVDANGRFDVPTAIAYGNAMSAFGLRWYEEPGDPLDYHLMSELAAVYPHRLATGENLFSTRDVDNLIRFGGMRRDRDLFQMDPALSYGLGEFNRMVESVVAAGYPRKDVYPHGGHMIALHIVVGLGLGGSEAYPGVFAPIGGYTDECVVEGGGVRPGSSPGFGLEAKVDLAPHITQLLAA
jgi:L-alanine-DL-glutamate epimerase-like enolase superfamily enzyme